MKARTLFLMSFFVLVTPVLFAAYGPQQGIGGGNPKSLIFMLIAIFIFIYLLFILPKRRIKLGKVSLPVQKLRIAYLLILIQGGSNFLIELFVVLLGNRELVGFIGMGMGIGYLVSGYYVMKKSLIALGIAIGIHIIYVVIVQTYLPFLISGQPITTSYPNFIGLAIFLYFVGRAFDAIRELKQVRESN